MTVITNRLINLLDGTSEQWTVLRPFTGVINNGEG